MASLPDSFGWFHPHLQSHIRPRLNKEGHKIKGHEQGKRTLREVGVLKGVENKDSQENYTHAQYHQRTDLINNNNTHK